MQDKRFARLCQGLLLRGKRILLLLCIALITLSLPGKVTAYTTDSTFRLSADFPHIGENKKLINDFYFSSPVTQSGNVSFSCFRYSPNGDSLFVYGQKQAKLKLKVGTSIVPIKFGTNDAGSFVHSSFYNILRKYSLVPAGSYRLYIIFRSDSGFLFQKTISLQADSTLPATSSLSNQLGNKLAPEKKPGFFSSASKTVRSAIPASKTLENHTAGIGRLLKSRGLTPQTEQRGNKSYVNLWYEDWYVGRYELEANRSAASQVQKQKAQAAGNVSSLAGSELESYRSLFSQVRELSKSEKQDNELKGELAVTGNFSNGQPEYSAQDNNYYEVRGRAETEVSDIPVSIEGYYTTQDAHRLVKGSYIRVHYDAERSKAKLMKLIAGYRGQFGQTVAKGKGLEQVYGSYLNNLQGSKDRALIDLKREAGIPALGGAGGGGNTLNTDNLQAEIEASLTKKMQDTAGMLSGAEGKLDSAGRLKRKEVQAARIKDSAAHLYARAMKRYEQVKKTEALIEKYQALLSQYKNTAYFDSALAYNKVKDLKSGDETTYKQMAKSAAGLLPEGKAKTFIAGLTNLDAGIINKYSSKYTAAGQQLTGLDVGYDIGFAQVGLTVGKTEYAGRDGSLDKYTTYSGRMLFTPAKGQKASLIYYGYTPSKSMLQDNDFFKNTDIALPTFRQPVHIVSTTYEGMVAKVVTIDAEAATSFRNGSSQDFKSGFDADRLAWHLNADGRIPRTPLNLIGSYEHGGKEFQNATLPVTISGTDLYKAGLKGELFHSFLTAGLEFNHMQQANLYSTGGNNRWGFEIATHSKQYPSVSVSYKPFATFRAATDTLAVPQRPLQGAVWTGKASYQIKKKGGVSYRFSAVLNRSTSHTDSASYGADLLQLNGIYTDKLWMLMLSTGQSMMATSSSGYSADTLNPAHVKTTFGTGSASYSFSKGMSVTGGADIGFAPFGLSKWGLLGGLSYQMKAAPLTARISGRYSAYRLAGYSGVIGSDLNGTGEGSPMSWRQLVSGSVELIWQFRMKING